jgi:hypothetical protein
MISSIENAFVKHRSSVQARLAAPQIQGSPGFPVGSSRAARAPYAGSAHGSCTKPVHAALASMGRPAVPGSSEGTPKALVVEGQTAVCSGCGHTFEGYVRNRAVPGAPCCSFACAGVRAPQEAP